MITEEMSCVCGIHGKFYFLDFDYPKYYELGIIFQDSNVPEDIAAHFNLQLTSYKDFKTKAVE